MFLSKIFFFKNLSLIIKCQSQVNTEVIIWKEKKNRDETQQKHFLNSIVFPEAYSSELFSLLYISIFLNAH